MAWRVLSILGLAVLTAVATAPLLPSPGGDRLSTEGYEPVDDLRAAGNLLALKSGCYLLEMAVSEHQSAAIQAGRNSGPAQRPMTHDLLLRTVEATGGTVEGVKVRSLVNGTYRASIVLDTVGGLKRIDARPSDATALAVRANATIFIRKGLLREHAQDLCSDSGGDAL